MITLNFPSENLTTRMTVLIKVRNNLGCVNKILLSKLKLFAINHNKTKENPWNYERHILPLPTLVLSFHYMNIHWPMNLSCLAYLFVGVAGKFPQCEWFESSSVRIINK